MASERARTLTSEGQVEAAIALLDDESESVVEGCRRALRAHAEMAEPLLREHLSRARGGTAEVLRSALLDIVGARLEDPLVAHIAAAPDLQAGSILIGRLVDAGEGPAALPAALDALAAKLLEALGGARSPERELAALREVLVQGAALRGADAERPDPLDAVVHGALARGRGLPLPLSIAWLLVARRAQVPLRGVNMPGHFLLRYERDGLNVVLDPFHGGRPVDEADCRGHLRHAGYPALDVKLLDATDRDMLLRTLRNLVMIGSRGGDRDLAARCARILHRTNAPAEP